MIPHKLFFLRALDSLFVRGRWGLLYKWTRDQNEVTDKQLLAPFIEGTQQIRVPPWSPNLPSAKLSGYYFYFGHAVWQWDLSSLTRELWAFPGSYWAWGWVCAVLCLVTQSCPTLCDPMDCNMPDFPILHCLPGFAQTHVHWVNDAI